MTISSAPVIAIVGCGAISESFHLPALAADEAVRERLVLIDRDLARARELAARFGVSTVAADLEEVIDSIDGAVIAVPHQLHYRLARQCVTNGVHVLCEKPLAETAARVDELVVEAERAGVQIAVNNTRRLIPSHQRVRQLIAAGEIGQPQRLDFRWGEAFSWPSATHSYFGVAAEGRGVLSDFGSHALDLVCWWLDGSPALTSYLDDFAGGTEAVAQVAFEVGGCAAEVRLSWLSTLDNRCLIGGSAGAIECGLYDFDELTLIDRAGKRRVVRTGDRTERYEALARPLIDNFLSVVRDGAEPLISARDVAPSIALIEQCYGRRSPFSMPWNETLSGMVVTA